MNMVTCTERCKHQRDGFCHLENGASPSASTNRECCFYEPVIVQKKQISGNKQETSPQFF